MKPTRAKTPGKMTSAGSRESVARAPVRVYCRVRQPAASTRPGALTPPAPCLSVTSATTVSLAPPEGRSATATVTYSFREVFPPDATQNEVFTKVALPLVENLIRGKNGLLFAYGVTGSGKTYTMTGEPQRLGILPRCLASLFHSIEHVQARRLVIRPDRANTFEVQSDADAALQRQQLLHKMPPKTPKKNNSNPDLAVSSTEVSKIQGLDEDCMYAVFVNYIEIYNNIVYDLLDEGTLGRRSPLTKIIREDGNHNMYVHGVTEVEVKTCEEALEAFYKGLKRKRMAHTSLNAESSRSHSVFTIRLVQAPVDSMGESLVQDKKLISVRQLSLVDLAGSERTSRTNNTGQRLREAGNINNSLMSLRTCLEVLRENQQLPPGVPPRVVPYRDAKVTHLFKNFFDGEGHVRMCVCVNPSCEDYDETMQVMRFAEVAMEVEVAKPRPMVDLGAGMTPGRRKANMLFKQARSKILAASSDENLAVDLALVYSLGGDFPSLELGSSRAQELVQRLQEHLQLRLQRRGALLRDKAIRDNKFRAQLDDLVKSSLFDKTELESSRAQLEQERSRVRALEQRLLASEDAVAALQRQLVGEEQKTRKLQGQLTDSDMLLNQKVIEKEIQKRKFSKKMATEHEKMTKELDHVLRLQREKLKKSNADKMRLVAQVLTEDGTVSETQGSVQTLSPGADMAAGSNRREAVSPTTTKRGFAVSNPRHRRSLSADGVKGEHWLQHFPKPAVPMGTGLKPHIPRKKSVTKLINIQDIANSKVSNYGLITQEQDTDGELETRLYKGNVIPTCGGGAQVVFKDVETLKQSGMNNIIGKKREVTDSSSKRSGQENKKPRV